MMARVARIVGQCLVTLVLASVVVFVLLRLVPGDPARVALGVTATEDEVAALRGEFGLDRPLVLQYLQWIGGVATGDLGSSFVTGEDMSAIILDRAAVSAWLVVPSLVIALVVAVGLGTWAAARRRRADGVLVSAAAQVTMAVPAFLLGVLLVLGFSLGPGWLPPSGWVVPSDDIGSFLAHLVLPVATLSCVQAGVLTRFVRGAMVGVLGSDFVRQARAAGLTRLQALWRVALPNAAVPVLTVLGVELASMLVGTVVVESVFDVPGLGSLLVSSVAERDLVTVQGVLMLIVAVVVVLNLLVDLVITLVDPRTRAVGVKA